jgi:hypothetical protein
MQHSKREWKESLTYSFPKTIGSFFREVLAVTLILTLEGRAWAYDFFTPGLVLFLILITFRVPYINSYAFLFETFSIDSWKMANHVGLQKHVNFSQNALHTLVVLGAHIGSAVGAAALRVYFDVAFGRETMSAQPGLAPALEINVDELRKFDSFWDADARLDRLSDQKIFNGTLQMTVPLGENGDLGIGQVTLMVWYIAEEIGYVFLLCVCFLHIWLGAGVGENKSAPMNPFKQRYWMHLFRVCVLLTLVYVALYRAFPTAHGSLHRTVYLCQYQAWNPNVHVIDTDNNEPFARIVGGLVGLLLGVGYNQILVNTEKQESTDESDFYFRLVWGIDPDPSHTRAKRTGGKDDGSSSDSDVESHHGKRWGYDPVFKGRRRRTMETVCVTRRQCGPDCAGMSCTCQSTSVGRRADFKLKLPCTLDHPK